MSEGLRQWLENIGLGQYEEIFAANDVDFDLLPELGDEDLKELGLSLGHRRRLQRALAEAPAGAAAPSSQSQPASAPGQPAERRQLTVMFCDLVSSTELSRRHDPEDLRELIRRYQDTVSGVVVRHGGYVANFLGDGIIAYFGWPGADEDDASQALRAGIGAVSAVRALSLQAHVGIASGIVVVGDLDAAGRRQTGAIAGETPNLASRLQSLAGPDQVVIDSLTRQLVGAGFVLDDLGPQRLKGIDEPLPAWRALAERAVESRFEARTGRLTRFVGREHEVALLLDRFERAAAGEGQMVLLSGEAGIGKSRIIRQLHEWLAQTPHTRLRFQCASTHTESALYPVIRHIEYAAGFVSDDEPELRLDKLETLLRRGAEDARESAALLAPIMSLPTDRYGSVDLSPEQRSERTLKLLVDQLLGLAAQQPVLYILEDAHWIDPTTRELVSRTMSRIGTARVLLVITYRPDFRSDWASHPNATVLTLNRLAARRGPSWSVRLVAWRCLRQPCREYWAVRMASRYTSRSSPGQSWKPAIHSATRTYRKRFRHRCLLALTASGAKRSSSPRSPPSSAGSSKPTFCAPSRRKPERRSLPCSTASSPRKSWSQLVRHSTWRSLFGMPCCRTRHTSRCC